MPIPTARPDRKCELHISYELTIITEPEFAAKRFMPTVPTLPNGISDALSTFPAERPANAKQTGTIYIWELACTVPYRSSVDSLLNPCRCKNVWQCRCRNTDGGSPASTPGSSSNGLAALAEAAALFYDEISSISAQQSSGSATVSSRLCCTKDTHPTDINPAISSARFDLPPVRIHFPIPTSSSSSKIIPEFPVIPPFSAVSSIAGSGCTCGLRCACPDCTEHRGPVHASKDCADGCHHCVDYSSGVELPTPGQGPSRNSMIDLFFTRAAALPSPPTNRKTGIELDPTDITIYPMDLFAKPLMEDEERGAAFGLVTVPKLECCGGRCSCPRDSCGCGQSCDGCFGNQCVQDLPGPCTS